MLSTRLTGVGTRSMSTGSISPRSVSVRLSGIKTRVLGLKIQELSGIGDVSVELEGRVLRLLGVGAKCEARKCKP